MCCADYPELAIAARELGTDIRSAYADALGVKEREEREQDQYCTCGMQLSEQDEARS